MNISDDNSWATSFADVCLILMLAIVMILAGKHLARNHPTKEMAQSRIDVFLQIDDENGILFKCNGKRDLRDLKTIIKNALSETNKILVSVHGDKNVPLWYIVELNGYINEANSKSKKVVIDYDLL